MKMLMHSNAPFCNTGYGCQTRIFAPRFQAAGHEIAVSCFYGLQGSRLKWNDLLLLPAGHDVWGNDIISAHAAAWFGGKARDGLVLTLMDVWVLNPGVMNRVNWAAWCVTEGTSVAMVDGSAKRIENVMVGERVLGHDGERLVEATVTATHKIPSRASGQLLRITTDSGRVLEITSDNLVWVAHGDAPPKWIAAACIRSGDVVYCYDSRPHTAGEVRDDRAALDGRRGQATTRQLPDDALCADRADDWDDVLIRATSCVQDGTVAPKPAICGIVGCSMAAGTDAGTNRVPCGDDRRRGHGQHSPCQPRTADQAAVSAGRDDLRHRCATGGAFADNATGAVLLTRAKNRELQAAVADRLARSPLPTNPDVGATASDREARAGGGRDRVHHEPDVDAELQQSLHAGAANVVREGARLECERAASVVVIPSPEYVFDLTTSTGNFVAGGFLIHNCPIDHDPAPPAVVRSLQQGNGIPIAISRFGERKLREAGFDPFYVPHGIDTTVYAPTDKAEAKKRLGIDPDRFLVLMVAANKGNPSRKSFPEAIEAFENFRTRHDDALLFLHTEQTGIAAGINLPELMQTVGIPPTAAGFCDQYQNMVGYPDEHMAILFNAADVLLQPSMGEGFGIPIIEAQACGTPVIVTDFTAMSELCGSGWKVRGQRIYTAQASWQMVPNMKEIEDALEHAYRHRGDAEMQKEARRFAERYDADKVMTEHWTPTLEAVKQRIQPELKLVSF